MGVLEDLDMQRAQLRQKMQNSLQALRAKVTVVETASVPALQTAVWCDSQSLVAGKSVIKGVTGISLPVPSDHKETGLTKLDHQASGPRDSFLAGEQQAVARRRATLMLDG